MNKKFLKYFGAKNSASKYFLPEIWKQIEPLFSDCCGMGRKLVGLKDSDGNKITIKGFPFTFDGATYATKEAFEQAMAGLYGAGYSAHLVDCCHLMFIWNKGLTEVPDYIVEAPSLSNTNFFTFTAGSAPTTLDFETAIGFSLTNPVNDGTTIAFDNTGYHIADNAFAGNTDLISVETAPNVTAGDSCFTDCTSLASGFNSLTTAGESCFKNCTSLASGFNSLTTVGDSCFANCTSLTSLNFDNVTNYGTTVGDDTVFSGIVGNTISVTAKTIHQTSNGGGLEGDLDFLNTNNTVAFTWVP